MTFTYTPESIKADYPGWEDEHKLSLELEKLDNRLKRADWGLLISAIRTGNPVVLTRNRGPVNYDGPDYYDTNTVIVKYMSLGESGNSNRIRVHYWGFSHDTYISEIHSIATPEGKLRKLEELND